MLGACAKRTVVCRLTAFDDLRGISPIGVNLVRNPVKVCPREPGEGYEKCRTVCQTNGHAEIQALAQAKAIGMNIKGWTATIYGHHHVCKECSDALHAAGISKVTIYPEL